MDFGLYVMAAIAWFFIRIIDMKKIKPVPFLIESLLLCGTIFILSFIGNAISTYLNISLSPWDYLPTSINLWIGGILMLSATCYLALKPWKNTASYENKEK